MVYKVIGLMSGSSLDGLDIVYVHLQEKVVTTKDSSRKWEYNILHAACYPYSVEWKERLAGAVKLSAMDYQLLHTDYGHYLGQQVRRFIAEFGLDYQVQLIASHGHTTFHLPGRKMTAQLGDGAALAAETGINVVADLRAMDVALGGQGAPIVPMGEKLLLSEYELFLNLGGIANMTAIKTSAAFVAFDVCPANRVLNELAEMKGKDFDEGGAMARGGSVDERLLDLLNGLDYYSKEYPKSLGNEFGLKTVLPLVREVMEHPGTDNPHAEVLKNGERRLPLRDALRTYVEHIAVQVRAAALINDTGLRKMLVTGGGAHNTFLIERLTALLEPLGITVVVPEAALVDYKEALIMALLGVLRWREEHTALSSVTGAARDSIGGAVWMG